MGQKHTLLREFAASDLIAAQFCREQGLSEVTFSQWRRKLANAADSLESSAWFARVRVGVIRSDGINANDCTVPRDRSMLNTWDEFKTNG